MDDFSVIFAEFSWLPVAFFLQTESLQDKSFFYDKKEFALWEQSLDFENKLFWQLESKMGGAAPAAGVSIHFTKNKDCVSLF